MDHAGTADGLADHSFLLLKRLLLRAAVGEEVLHDQFTHPHHGPWKRGVRRQRMGETSPAVPV